MTKNKNPQPRKPDSDHKQYGLKIPNAKPTPQPSPNTTKDEGSSSKT